MEFAVGIDLGTTQSALAASPLSQRAIEVFPVPQLGAPGQLATQPLLASALYLPGEGELPAGATALPWGDPGYVVGDAARRLGAASPGRLVVSAKSWLSHAGVDRTAAILPWGAPAGVPRIAPGEASARVLSHLRAAWDRAHPGSPLAEQEVVLTVPASFDEVARELTVAAARAAGLSSLRLLEEPQAAFLDLLDSQGAGALGDARVVLVVDVGGGTTDFTLLAVAGGYTRIAVGDHLILGGDNMDVTLARHVEPRLDAGSLDASSWSALVQSSRQAKESLLSAGGPPAATVTLPGRGAGLVGGARSCTLGREEAEGVLLDGFFPRTGPDELPARSRVALTELGLPYAADPAVPRHLCAFLRRHARAAHDAGARVAEGLPRPDAVLLNGGVFEGAAIAARLSEVLAGWYGEPVPLLPHDSLDVAVARGAAAHALARRGKGVRIKGGTARAYYVGVDVAGERRALCLVPRGLEEGQEAAVDRIFRLVLDRPVSFPLYATSADRDDEAGALVSPGDELEALPPMATVLRSTAGGGEVPVQLAAQLTEIGTLEVSLREHDGSRRWRLEFGTRGEGGGAALAPQEELPRRFPEARRIVERAYGKKAEPVEAREIKNLWRGLEREIGPRESWSWAVNRELWGVGFSGAGKRRRSPEHERVFFQLAGFCLRPGFGAPLDAWRVTELWGLFPQGVQYTAEKPNWSEWWILWRRVAGGLSAGQQRAIFEVVRPWLRPAARGAPRPKGPRAEGQDEMLRLAASLERLAPAEKEEVAEWAWARIEAGTLRSFWPFGRLLARAPFSGSAHDVVPPGVALPWLDRLLVQDLGRADGAAFAVARIAARTGDRARDLPDDARERAAAALRAAGSPAAWVQMVREAAPLAEEEEMRVFGETLPAGLRLTSG